MSGIVIFISILIISAVITIIWEIATPDKNKKEEHINSTSLYIPNDITEEEFKKDFLYQAKLNNLYLEEINLKLKKQNEMLNDMKFNVGCLTIAIVIPIILYILIKILSLMAGYNLLQDLI